ncbi:hypothetical protein AX17_002139 [Amanita inopinata Kibby_2008]|nr:hypothetical protein AX17_002139 [Amanita inopinata Kibby_2008]
MASDSHSSPVRGRSSVRKPLSDSASHQGSPESIADASNDAGDASLSPPTSATSPTNEDLPLPKENASPTPADPVVTRTSEPRDLGDSDSNLWLHMTTLLESCFNTSNKLEFEDEPTNSDDILVDAPRIMQGFLSHGDACTRIEVEALDLVSNGPSTPDEDEPLRVYNEMLNDLELLQEKAVSLESSISRLAGIHRDENEATDIPDKDKDSGPTDHPSAAAVAHAELRRVFAACLPVLRARIENLTMAQDLLDSAQENLSLKLRMEDLGID